MKKLKLIFLFSVIFLIIGIMPSQVFGKNTLLIEAEKYTYSKSRIVF